MTKGGGQKTLQLVFTILYHDVLMYEGTRKLSIIDTLRTLIIFVICKSCGNAGWYGTCNIRWADCDGLNIENNTKQDPNELNQKSRYMHGINKAVS